MVIHAGGPSFFQTVTVITVLVFGSHVAQKTMTIERHAPTALEQRLAWNPAVLLLGPRQVGKTTLGSGPNAGQARIR